MEENCKALEESQSRVNKCNCTERGALGAVERCKAFIATSACDHINCHE